MNILIDFLLNNYIWLVVISLIIIFALIGYLVDTNDPNIKKKKKQVKPISDVNDEKIHVHTSVKKYMDDNFDEPLINEKNA